MLTLYQYISDLVNGTPLTILGIVKEAKAEYPEATMADIRAALTRALGERE